MTIFRSAQKRCKAPALRQTQFWAPLIILKPTRTNPSRYCKYSICQVYSVGKNGGLLKVPFCGLIWEVIDIKKKQLTLHCFQKKGSLAQTQISRVAIDASYRFLITPPYSRTILDASTYVVHATTCHGARYRTFFTLGEDTTPTLNGRRSATTTAPSCRESWRRW